MFNLKAKRKSIRPSWLGKHMSARSMMITAITISLLATTSSAQAPTCANSQILLNNQCVDCNALLDGCTQCSLRSDSVSSLQCDTCDFGFYLLSLSSQEVALNGKASICVERCEDFAYNWVSNSDTMRCEFCGPTCTLCSPKYGCLADYRWDRGSKFVQSVTYPVGQFPFSAKAPSTQFVTTKDCADKRCDKCQTLDAVKSPTTGQAQCDSCYAYVNLNYAGMQALLNCTICDTSSVTNCLNCDPDEPSVCVSCREDYYIDRAQNKCLFCADDLTTASGCKRCSKDGCQECMPGYYETTDAITGRVTCTKCALTNFNAAYALVPNRCTQCQGESAPDKCKYCNTGFLGSTNKPDSCELKCSTGQYPVVTYIKRNNNENLIDTTQCVSCHTSCDSCIGSLANQCSTCPVGNYLTISQAKSKTGTCSLHIAAQPIYIQGGFDIYVSNLEPSDSLEAISTKMELSTIGSFLNPFYHIDDAFVRAQELAVPYSPSVTVIVTIHMFKGDHFLMETRGGSTLPHYQHSHWRGTDSNLNFALFVKPLECSQVPGAPSNTCFASLSDNNARVTIYNKRREKLKFDVPVSLTLSGIIIDSIDSILHTQPLGTALPACLSERRECCTLNTSIGDVANFNPTDTFKCSDSFKLLFKTMETDCFANWPRSIFKMRLSDDDDGIKKPNVLTLESNSGVKNTFYAMNSLVAFSSAGGIVTISKSSFSYIHTCGSIVSDSFAELPHPSLENFVNRQYLSAEQIKNIAIIWTYQQAFAGKTAYQSYMDSVGSTKTAAICGGLDYCTQIVINKESQFSNMPFGQNTHSDAQLVSEKNGLRHLGYVITLEDSTKKSSLEVFDSMFDKIKAPFDGCLPYESLIAINTSRVQPVGSLNNFRQLRNPSSDFNRAQIQGPFIIRSHRGPLVFQKNTFRDSISYGGALSIDQIEGAVFAEQNNFMSNSALVDSSAVSFTFGRQFVEGSTDKSQCGGVQISSNKFTNNIGCEDTVGAISMRCLAAEGWSSNQIMDTHSFELDGQMPIHSDLSQVALKTQVTDDNSLVKTSFSSTFVGLKNNEFSYNFAGTDTAVVSILGFAQVIYESNKHFQNENWIANSFRTQSTLFRQQTSITKPEMVSVISKIQTRAKAIVHFRALKSLSALSNTFDNNFVVDVHSPYASAGTIQSNGILIQDLKGDLDMSGSSFKNNGGLSGNNRVGIYPVPTGFTSRLIAFQSCAINKLAFDDMSFTSNKGEMQVYEPTNIVPQLFVLEQTILASVTQQVSIKNLQLTGNEFINTGSVITFRLQNLMLNDLILQANKGDSIIAFEYINDIAIVHLSNPEVKTNEIKRGSTFLAKSATNFESTGYAFSTASNSNNLVHLKVANGTFSQNIVAKTADVTGQGPRAACIEFAAATTAAWAYIEIIETVLKDNLGVVTNDIFVDETVVSLKLLRVTWEGSISQTSIAKKAQVIYRPSHYNFILLVKQCTFTCTGISFEREVILNNNVEMAQGRASLFHLGQAENVEVLPILQKETKIIDALPDGFLNSDGFTLRFMSNVYKQCNHVEKGAVFYLEKGARVHDYRSDYGDCSALAGGLAYVTGHGTYLKIELPSAQISEMFAYQGAVVFVEKGATVEMINNVIVHYSEAYEGTIAYVVDRSRFIINTSIDISYNRAHRRGLFYVSDGSQIYANELRLFGNSAGYDSVILYAENNRVEYHIVDDSSSISAMDTSVVESWLENLDISRNRIVSKGRLITLIESNFTISDSQFTSNEISTDNYGVYASYAEVDILNCKFVGPADPYVHYDLDNFEYSDVNGAFIQAQEYSRVWVSKCEFTGGRGIYGGCIIQQGYSRLKIEDSQFYMCTAEYGGAIYASAHRSLEVRRSNFTMNYSFIGYGQNIYSVNAYEQLVIEDSSFKSYHNSIYTTGYSVSITNCILEGDGQNRAAHPAITYLSDGGALYIEQTARVVVKKTEFRNLRARYGGALYIHQDRLTNTALTLEKNYRTIRPYYFSDVKFENCEAEFDGGAIYVRNPLRMTIQQASFFNNSAGREGGAVQYVCEPTARDLRVDPQTPCDFVLDEIVFTENKAFNGGAIRWNLMEMEVGTGDQSILTFTKDLDGSATYGTLRFMNNFAEEYGPEIASVARELVKFNDTETYLKYYSGSVLARQELVTTTARTEFFNNYVFDGVQSGGSIPTLFLGLIDKYGQVVTINRGSKIEFVLQSSTKADSEYETKILGVTDFFSAYGTYNMSGMGLITAPLNRIKVGLVLSGINLDVPSNRNYLSQQLGREISLGEPSTSYALDIKMIVRGCILGEGLRQSGACYECPFGTYLLEAPIVPTICQDCDRNKAFCLGGKQVGPKPGFWRASAASYNFWPCPEPSQCLGMDTELPYDAPGNANGLCDVKKGYYGVMCTACLPGFKRSGLLNCEPCKSAELLNIIVIMAGLIIGVCLLVYMTTIKGTEKQTDSSVFNKILMNHLQMLIITSDFDMNWPKQVIAIFNVASPINELTEAIVNFDCFMDTRDASTVSPYVFDLPGEEIRVYSQKVMIMALLPAGLAILSYAIWYIICRIQRTIEKLYTKFIATLVLLLFLVHPALTKKMVDVFNCTTYDGVSRLNSDYQVKCYSDPRHAQLAYYVALPALLIWGLGIPATIFQMISKKEDKLTLPNVQEQFGFLYNGYKRHNYYWEIVIMYRKILCIFVAVFLRPQGVIVQALVLLIMLGIFLQANNTSRPFKTRQLNDIENMSVATQIITIYCGIFFISAKKQDENFVENRDFALTESGKILLVMIIAFCNSFFILLWMLKFLDMYRNIILQNSKKIYVVLFLCGRVDKLEKEAARRASVAKREKIIASIENTILYLNKMKNIYANNSCYEDNIRFLKMMYHIESEMSDLDLTEKRNNYYIQGNMARDRKFDRERMKEVANQQSLEVDDAVNEVMQLQNPDWIKEQKSNDEDDAASYAGTDRTDEEIEAKKESARLRQTPFLEHLRKLNKAQKQKIASQNDPTAGRKNMMRQGTMRTILLPRQHTLRSDFGGGSSISLMKAKSEWNGQDGHHSQMGGGIMKLQKCSVNNSDLQPQNGSPDIGEDDSPLPFQKNVSIDLLDNKAEKDSLQRTIESPQDFLKQMDWTDPSHFQQFHVDENGEIIMDESDDAHEYQDGQSPKMGKGDAGTRDRMQQQKKKSKKNDIYLDNLESVSRNQTNLIKRDRKNLTVGKVLNKDSQARLKISVGELATRLRSQFFGEQDQMSAMSNAKKEDLDRGHVQDLEDVDQSLDSQDRILHKMRQLTDRDANEQQKKGATKEKSITGADLRSQGQSQADMLASRQNTFVSGGAKLGSEMVSDIMTEKSNKDTKSEGFKTDRDEKTTDKGSEAPKQTEPEIEEEEEEEEPKSKEKKDLGPLALVEELKKENEADQNPGYQILRERDVPRRQLFGDYVEDACLDHSDSFRTIQTDDAGEESVAPDKSIGDSIVGDKDEVTDDDKDLTPRKRDEQLGKFEQLELECSPESKWSIQISPAKGDQIQDAKPEKKKARPKPKVRVADHDHIDIPFFDNFGNGTKYPEYRMPELLDDKDSPEKGSNQNEGLPIFNSEDELKELDETDSLKTDSSMRDFPYDLDEHEVFYKLQKAPVHSMLNLPRGAQKETEDMGAGLVDDIPPKLLYPEEQTEGNSDKDDGGNNLGDILLDDKGGAAASGKISEEYDDDDIEANKPGLRKYN